MRRHVGWLLATAALCWAAAWPPPAGAVGQARPALLVIVGSNAPIDDIGMGTLRRVFRGESQTLGGKRLIPFNYSHTDRLRQAFDRLVLGLEPHEVGRYWIDRRIRGQGLAPRTVQSPSLLRAVVARLPGAIGYIAQGEPLDRVKALRVDGKAPDHPRYPLR